MQIERFYLGCLAHASYLMYDEGEAAVIDPQRDVGIYLARAAELGVRIRWVVETHLHADFVSGHLELAARSGAAIAIGAGSGATYPHRELRDGDDLRVGRVALRTMATPGHTEESVCLAVVADGRTQAVFTGDTLFIGDVGRPDLSPNHTPEQLAAMLYESLHGRLMTLPGNTVVYPAHGAGSLCGRSMSSDASSTIERERRMNYALQPMSRGQFVALLTGDLPPRPAYFQDEVQRNRTGSAALQNLPPVLPLSCVEVLALQAAGAILLDTRPWAQFAAAHIPGSLNIALGGQFASWAARMMGIQHTRVVLLAEDASAVAEARLRLARVGIEDVAGNLEGGIMAWMEAGQRVEAIDPIRAIELTDWLRDTARPKTLLDVRDSAERQQGAIPGSTSIPLPELYDRLRELDRNSSIAVHCRSGYRSAIACSILQAAGFPEVVNLIGGYDAWVLANAPAAPLLNQSYLATGNG